MAPQQEPSKGLARRGRTTIMRRLKQLDRSEALPANRIHGSGQVFSTVIVSPISHWQFADFLCFSRRIVPRLAHASFSCEPRWMCFQGWDTKSAFRSVSPLRKEIVMVKIRVLGATPEGSDSLCETCKRGHVYQEHPLSGGGCLLTDLLHWARDPFSGSRVHVLGGPLPGGWERWTHRVKLGLSALHSFVRYRKTQPNLLTRRPIAISCRMIATERSKASQANVPAVPAAACTAYAGRKENHVCDSLEVVRRRPRSIALRQLRLGNRAKRLSQRRGRVFLPSRRPQRIGSLCGAWMHRLCRPSRARCVRKLQIHGPSFRFRDDSDSSRRRAGVDQRFRGDR